MSPKAPFPKWLAAGLFLALFSFTPGRLISWDAGVRLQVASLLWQQGTVLAPKTEPAPRDLIYVAERDAYTSYFGIGQSLLFIPFDMIGQGLGWAVSQVAPGARTHDMSGTFVASFYPPLAGLLWVYCLAQALAALGVAPRTATIGASVGLISTIGFYYSSQTCQEEITVAALFAASLRQWALWKKAPSLHRAFWGTLLGTLPVLFRLNAVFAGLALAGYVFGQRGTPTPLDRPYRKQIPVLLLAAAIPLLTFALFAWWRFGSPFATGYHALWRTEPYATTGSPMGPIRPWVALSLLFGLGKGFLSSSPVLLLSALGLMSLRRTYPGVVYGCVAMLFGSALFHSRLMGWPDGSECWGNRYLVHTLSLLALPTLLGAQLAWSHGRGRMVVASLLFLGTVFQLSATFMPEGVEYIQNANARRPQHEGLLASDLNGQLPRRLLNTAAWWSGFNLPNASSHLETMVSSYVPNLWGPVYSKRFGSYWGLLWLLTLAGGAIALAKGGTRLRATAAPDVEPKKTLPSKAA